MIRNGEKKFKYIFFLMNRRLFSLLLLVVVLYLLNNRQASADSPSASQPVGQFHLRNCVLPTGMNRWETSARMEIESCKLSWKNLIWKMANEAVRVNQLTSETRRHANQWYWKASQWHANNRLEGALESHAVWDRKRSEQKRTEDKQA